MKTEIFAKFVNQDYVEQELINIGFDSTYRNHACLKNTCKTIKILNLKPQEASILKQSALALGFDAGVHRGVLDCSVEYSDELLSGNVVQFKKLVESLQRQPFKMKKVSQLIESLIDEKLMPIRFRKTSLEWSKPYIMGILNVTPNSFSDGGRYYDIENAINRVQEMINDGADIIDIGAESTHPNNDKITVEEEIKRLKPILQELKKINFSVPISIDTRNVMTAKMAHGFDIDMINDVGFGDFNYDMISFVNSSQIPYVYTHNKFYEKDVIDNVFQDFIFILEKVTAPLILDIGVGFGKSLEQNYELLNRVSEFKGMGKPLLVGHSRKSFLSKSFNVHLDQI